MSVGDSYDFTPATVRRLASMVRISLTEEETIKISRDLSKVVEYFGELSKLDLDRTEPTYTVTRRKNASREDRGRTGLDQATAVQNAISQDGFIKAPRV
jgi:aspartyl/glutamyl-tRNA(Asn/Gln) amidotransferase C subunit